MADSSNTTPKQLGGATGKGFVKGDPRINRKGRPRSFDALRDLAQSIAHEEVKDGAGQPAVIDGHIVTKAELIMRTWAQSKDPRLQQAFIEVAYGKTAQQVELSGKNGGPIELIVKYVNKRND
jgi:hypothetical protein